MSKSKSKIQYFELCAEILDLAQDCAHDNNYLQIANKVQKLHQLTDKVIALSHTPHWQHLQNCYARRNLNECTLFSPTVPCKKCGRFVKQCNLKRHYKSIVCQQIQKEKELSADYKNKYITKPLAEKYKVSSAVSKIQRVYRKYKNNN